MRIQTGPNQWMEIPDPIPYKTDPNDPRLWWIDIGPYKDRLGMDALAIAASDDQVCRAVKEQLYDRKYVDLKDPKIRQLMMLTMQNGQPAANAKFPGSGPFTQAKIDAVLNTPTTEAERTIKGL